jgi:hypothetical protein
VAGQTVTVNKYFANTYDIDWGDSSTDKSPTDAITHTYSEPGPYIIRLTSATYGRYQAWSFKTDSSTPLIPASNTTAQSVSVFYLPPMERFQTDTSTAPNDFFVAFNRHGALTSLPDGSFNTSKITRVGNNFFIAFNGDGKLTSLPDGSFNTSNITSVGNFFFGFFNDSGALTSLPDGSFNTSNITSVRNNFFRYFNDSGALTSLPDGSFNTSNITSVNEQFFASFNNGGALTSLPDGSFNMGSITSVGEYFLSFFSNGGALTSLPASFVFPALDEPSASKTGNFVHTFDSSTAFTIRDGVYDVARIINNCATPNTDRDTFSSNHPGYSSLDPNWKGV